MSKIKTGFFCQNCGYESAKWIGKCPACNEWNTFAEELISKDKNENKKQVWKEATSNGEFKTISLSDRILAKDPSKTKLEYSVLPTGRLKNDGHENNGSLLSNTINIFYAGGGASVNILQLEFKANFTDSLLDQLSMPGPENKVTLSTDFECSKGDKPMMVILK